jgi:hemolysin activation/secretion protein
MSRTVPCLTSAALALTVCCCFGIGAEDPLRPAAEQPTAGPVIRRAADGEGQVSDENAELVASLRAVIICQESAAGLARQRGASGVVVCGEFSGPEAAAVTAAGAPFLGQPVSLASLDSLSAAVTRALERRGGPVLRAGFPDQEITGGTVVLQVVPAVAGRVAVRGTQAFGRDFLDAAWSVKPGAALLHSAVQSDLDWLNENPLRRVTAAFAPGPDERSFDVLLDVEAKKPWRAYAGMDNSLSDRLGDERWFAGWQYGDVFGRDHRFSLMATASLDYDSLHGASLLYEAPLAWRHLLEFSAGVSESQSVEGAGLSLVDRNGLFRRTGLRYRVPFAAGGEWRGEWFGGASFRDHEYEFMLTSRSVQMFQLESGCRLRRQTGRAASEVTASLHWSPGGIGSGDEDYQALGADGAESFILRLLAQHSISPGGGHGLNFRVDAQWSDSHLLASDQFAPAINGRLRGFDEVTGYGDSGISGSVEYLTPPWRPRGAGTLRGVVFVDGAIVHDRRDGVTDSFAAAGCGFRWQRGDISASCDLGIPLSAPDGVEEDARLRFSVTTRF